jgi:hypothetical protein
MRPEQILAGRGHFKIAQDGVAYTNEDYHFYGFVPHADITVTNLKAGNKDLSTAVSGIIFKQGVFYPMGGNVGNGYGTEITISGGDACLYLTWDSPKKY